MGYRGEIQQVFSSLSFAPRYTPVPGINQRVFSIEGDFSVREDGGIKEKGWRVIN